MIVVCCATDAWSGMSYSGWTNANLTSVTERSDDVSLSGNGGAIGVATGVKAAAGSTGATTYTQGASGVKAMVTIALHEGVVQVADADTGSGAEAQVSAATDSDSDTAVGAEAALVLNPVSSTDSAASAESAGTSAAVVGADSAVGSEIPIFGDRDVSLTDTAVGAEEVSYRAFDQADSATGADTEQKEARPRGDWVVVVDPEDRTFRVPSRANRTSIVYESRGVSVPAEGLEVYPWRSWRRSVPRNMTNEVNVVDYGAIGDGVADDTAAIAAALAAGVAGSTIWFPNGTYLMSTGITVPYDNMVFTGGNAATLRLTDASSTRMITATAKNNVIISGLIFDRSVAYDGALGQIEQSVIRIDGSSNCNVEQCTLDFTGDAITYGITVREYTSFDNKICYNRILGTGIMYSYRGASRTLCEGNTILGAYQNALSGLGNLSDHMALDCRVVGNSIDSPGRMGIEDYVYIEGSLISGNLIRTTASYAISVVGQNTTISDNHVVDFTGYGIESFGNGFTISGNNVRQVAVGKVNTGIGCIVNSSSTYAYRGSTVSGNKFFNCADGVKLWSNPHQVSITGNLFSDCSVTGINAQSEDADTSVTIQGNVFRFATPNNLTNNVRYGIYLYSSTGTWRTATVIGNVFVWESTAAGGTSVQPEIAIRPYVQNLLVSGNTCDGGGITASGSSAPFFYKGHAYGANFRAIGNVLLGGGLVDNTGFTGHVLRLNAGITDV
jgi:hypothetical protein